MSMLQVVELGDRPGTALCAKLLSTLGASVTKVLVGEQSFRANQTSFPAADGTPVSGLRIFLDAGKDLVQLDAFESSGATLATLLESADVLVTCLTDDELRAWQVELDGLRDRHPSLTIAVLTPFADDGSGKPVGDELLAQAGSGMMTMIGEADREPLRLPGWQADYAAGSALVTSIIMSLVGRDRTGRGQTITTNAVRSMAFLDWKSQIFYAEEGTVLVRGSDRGPLVVGCTDGYLGFFYRPEDWEKVKRLIADPRLEDPRFATQQGRDEHRAEFSRIINEFTGAMSRRELYDVSQAGGIPAGPVWSLPELLNDPQYAARSFVRLVDSGELGSFTVPRVPFTVDDERPDEPDAVAPEVVVTAAPIMSKAGS